MTWHVSPEEWLLDFTSVPHGRVRGGESLDPIDDRLRTMLAPLPAKVGLIMPSITATRSPSRPGAPEPGRGRERSQPVLVSSTETIATEPATPEPRAVRTGASAGKKVSAASTMITEATRRMKSGPRVGNVPDVSGVDGLAASAPATARAGMIITNRPMSMAMAIV